MTYYRIHGTDFVVIWGELEKRFPDYEFRSALTNSNKKASHFQDFMVQGKTFIRDLFQIRQIRNMYSIRFNSRLYPIETEKVPQLKDIFQFTEELLRIKRTPTQNP